MASVMRKSLKLALIAFVPYGALFFVLPETVLGFIYFPARLVAIAFGTLAGGDVHHMSAGAAYVGLAIGGFATVFLVALCGFALARQGDRD